MASFVHSELLFSEAGNQVKDKRNRLDPEKVNKMLVFEDYYKFDIKKQTRLWNLFTEFTKKFKFKSNNNSIYHALVL